MPKFEAAVFNQKVRDLMKAGEKHRYLDDSWADIHYIDVTASSLDAARQRISSTHSSHEGYVIVSIEPADD